MALFLRVFLFVIPILAAFAVTTTLGRLVERSGWPAAARLGWLAAMFVGAMFASTVTARGTERLLPLSALCQLNLAFPEEAPSRIKLALRMGNPGRGERVVEEFQRQGLSADPQTAALQALELVNQLNDHDRKTRGHSERVRALSDVIAEELELSETDRALLRWGSLLHDMGKLSVPATILNKNGKPTDEEWGTLRGHPEAGRWRIEPLRGWLGDWANCVYEHHEHFDGTGYPAGLHGGQMALGSRIVAVADAFEVMTATRSYKSPMSYDDARAELVRCAGTHFDPAVVRAFVRVGRKRSQVATGLVSSWLGQLASSNGPAGTLIQVATGAAAASSAPVLRAVRSAFAGVAPQHTTSVAGAVSTLTTKLVTTTTVAFTLALPTPPTSMVERPRVDVLEWSQAMSVPPEQLAFAPSDTEPVEGDVPPTTIPAVADTNAEDAGGQLVFVTPGTTPGTTPEPARPITKRTATTTGPPATRPASTRTAPDATPTPFTPLTPGGTTSTAPSSSTTPPTGSSTTTPSTTTALTTTTLPATTTTTGTTTTLPVTTTTTGTTTTLPTTTTTTTTTTSTTTTTVPGLFVVGTPGCPAGQWRYDAFNNEVLVGPTAANGCEPTIVHGWGTSAPFPGVNADSFSIAWIADVSFPGGLVTFITRSDDGVRLYLDGVLIFDDWTIHAERYSATSQTVTAGVHAVRYEYFERFGRATASLDISAGPPPTPPTTTTPPPTTTTPPATTIPPLVTPLISTLASSASWGEPDGVAVDTVGNVYVVATEEDKIFKVSPLGVITTFAGSGSTGFTGDTGPAVAARLNKPSSVAVGPAGQVYISDSGNRRVRMVSTAGVITTVAGTGASGSSGDGGSPLAARFDTLEGIATRPNGNLLLADSNNRTIREIDFTANTITTVFGNGTDNGGGDGSPAIATGLKKPVDVTAHDDFFAVVDGGTDKVWDVTADGIAHFIAGGGSQTTSGSAANQFKFQQLRAISVIDDVIGHDLLVLDLGTSRLWRIDRQTGAVFAESGNGSAGNANPTGPAAAAELNKPQDIVSVPGVDYVADSGNQTVRKIVR